MEQYGQRHTDRRDSYGWQVINPKSARSIVIGPKQQQKLRFHKDEASL